MNVLTGGMGESDGHRRTAAASVSGKAAGKPEKGDRFDPGRERIAGALQTVSTGSAAIGRSIV